MVRQDETVAAPSHVISNLGEIGRHLIDIHDIETDVHDGPAPKTVAVEYFVEWYLEHNAEQFDISPAASDGNHNITYTGSDSNE